MSGAPANLLFVSDQQINAVLPDTIVAGWNSITVRNSGGSHTVGVLVEGAFPAVFTLDQSGAGAAAAVNANNGAVVSSTNPLHAGEYLELYLTGLGSTVRQSGLDYSRVQPVVTVGGTDCAVTYAGAAPGFPGLDQINCVVPTGLGSQEAAVVVTSGARSSPVTTVSVR